MSTGTISACPIRRPSAGRQCDRSANPSCARFPDFRYEIRAPLCIAEDGSAVVIPWTITATNTGVLEPPGFAATGRRVSMNGLDYLVFREGLVARIETRFDPAEAVEQVVGLKLRPPPGSWRERGIVLVSRAWAAWLRW